MKPLSAKIEAVIRSPDSRGLLPAVLGALSRGYGAAMALRAAAYRRAMFQQHRLPCKVVSIGNLTVGGTGKTPLTVYVARRLAAMGLKVAVLSRGYRSGAERTGAVVSDGKDLLLGPADAGDEPWMMARHLDGIPVLVGRDRYRSGLIACRRFGTEVAVLDDGFQHQRLKRDLDFVLLTGPAPFGNGHLLPRGPLREPMQAIGRAHALVLSGLAPEAVVPALTKPLFRARRRTVLRALVPPGRQDPGRGVEAEASDLETIKGSLAFGFSGLADNNQFRLALTALSVPLVGFSGFGDHHPYSRRDLDQVTAEALASGAEMLATTEKDLGRLPLPLALPLAVFGLDIDFGEDAAAFDVFLRQALNDGQDA